MGSTKAKKRLGSGSCRQIYKEWYEGSFDVVPSMKKTMYPNITDRKGIAYGKLVRMVSDKLGSDDIAFKKYLQYVFGEWKKTSGALIAHWHNWFASEKMMDRFKDILRKENIVNRTGGLSGGNKNVSTQTTWGDHTYTGVSDDEEFSL